MAPLCIGYARVSTDEQDLTAQRDALTGLGVSAERIYVDHGLMGTKAKGRLRGKQSQPRQEAHLVALHRAGEHRTAELGELFGVGRSTVYRAIQRDQRRQGVVR